MVAAGPLSISLYGPALPTIVADLGTTAAMGKLSLTVYFGAFALALSAVLLSGLSDSGGDWRGWLRRAFDVVMLAALLLSAWRYLQIGFELEEGLYSFTSSDLTFGVAGLLASDDSLSTGSVIGTPPGVR